MRRGICYDACPCSRLFQSQTRSRSTCDSKRLAECQPLFFVSISDEKPLHMRQRFSTSMNESLKCFNLRREAAPHATSKKPDLPAALEEFQSQTRSRSTCDLT